MAVKNMGLPMNLQTLVTINTTKPSTTKTWWYLMDSIAFYRAKWCQCKGMGVGGYLEWKLASRYNKLPQHWQWSMGYSQQIALTFSPCFLPGHHLPYSSWSFITTCIQSRFWTFWGLNKIANLIQKFRLGLGVWCKISTLICNIYFSFSEYFFDSRGPIS